MWEKMNTAVLLLILGGIGLAVYFLYDWFQNGDAGPTDDAGQTSSFLGALRGTNSVDPTTGQSTGLVDSFNNWVAGSSFPGGGEVAGSSETYTGALSETIAHPYDSLKSILGFN